jgi:ubiquinone/menaquinone biosynthesis C-methylase UbiE
MRLFTKLKKNLRILLCRDVTRSFGLLEYFLAAQRARMANKLISKGSDYKIVLDIGCGSYPIFLLTSKFIEKYGLDKIHSSKQRLLKKFNLLNYDIENETKLPFEDEYIDVVTMLAVLEHIEPKNLVYLFTEVFRILKSNGKFIITIPSPWADGILRSMVKLKLISALEIDDHKLIFRNSDLLCNFEKAGFKHVNFGYFEFFMNRWFIGEK